MYTSLFCKEWSFYYRSGIIFCWICYNKSMDIISVLFGFALHSKYCWLSTYSYSLSNAIKGTFFYNPIFITVFCILLIWFLEIRLFMICMVSLWKMIMFVFFLWMRNGIRFVMNVYMKYLNHRYQSIKRNYYYPYIILVVF